MCDILPWGSLANLILTAKSPTIGKAIDIDGNAMVDTAIRSLELDITDDSRPDQHTILALTIGNDVSLSSPVICARSSALLGVHATPGEQFAGLGDGERVVLAGGNVGDFVVGKLGDNLGARNDLEGFVCLADLVDSSLGKAVETPSPNRAIFRDGKTVILSGEDAGSFGRLLLESNRMGSEGGDTVALSDAATKLVLLTATPSEHSAFVVEGKDVIVTASNVDDILELGKVDGSFPDIAQFGETEKTVGALIIC